MKGNIKIKKTIIIMIFCVLFLLSAYIRKPEDNKGFFMSDATYHVLLTMQAYDETPSSIHHWLPIQTYDGDYNKWIDNGPSLLMDKLGNNYYVSFSPIGFYAPYFFCKIFHLPIKVMSIYFFNCLLMLISALLLGYIMFLLFKEKIYFWLATITYIFLPEVMYTQGIVYWHHSLSQIFLLLQIILFIIIVINKKENLFLWFIFYLCSFLYPYTEWTGVVSNVGMGIGILVMGIKKEKPMLGGENRKIVSGNSIIKIFSLACVTIGALGYYIFRFSWISTPKEIIYTMLSRAKVRGGASISLLLMGYKESYFPILIEIVLLFIIVLFNKDCRKKMEKVIQKKENWLIILVCTFPLAENIVMREHAIDYTFDRLKGAVLFILLLSLFFYILRQENKKMWYFLSIIFVGFVIGSGIVTYGNGKIVQMKQYSDSQILKEYLQKEYLQSKENILMKDGWRAWGYLQTLYHRNIYCTNIYSAEQINNVVNNLKSNFIICLEPTFEYSDTSCYTRASVINCNTSEVYHVSVNSGKIVIDKKNKEVYAFNLTDENWNNGISNIDPSEILLENSSYNSAVLKKAKIVKCNNRIYHIIKIDNDLKWIHLYVDKDASACGYPNTLYIE